MERYFRTGALEGPDGTLRTSLIRTVAQLETLPEDMKEHPRAADGLVKKNLINPSLYPFVKGQSLVLTLDKAPRDGSSGPPKYFLPLLSPVEDKTAAEKIFYQQKKIHPDFDDTYQWLPADIWIDAAGKATFLSYINNLNPVDFAEAYKSIEAIFSALLPHFESVLDKDLLENEEREILTYRSQRLKVIVKMTNTELTPERPKYPGGEYHTEGRRNEAIAAVGLYYYSLSNIKASSLEVHFNGFKARKHQPRTLPTTENSFIVFSNYELKHKVPEFTLDDPSKPGHRKMLAFFLCDPEKEVLSTGRVPPQQREWYLRELSQALPPFKCPPEVVQMIASGLPGTISRETALQRSRDMMEKRDREAREEGMIRRMD